MFKITLFCFFIFISSFKILIADEKSQIINRINEIDSLKFNFTQKVEKKIETGTCYILFPGLLKCNYNDDKEKELIINKTRLAITQKRYNKTYYYPVSKSPFLKILNKNNLINIIEKGTLSYKDKKIILSNLDAENQSFKIFFDSKNYNLGGWEIEDRFGKIINFGVLISTSPFIFLNYLWGVRKKNTSIKSRKVKIKNEPTINKKKIIFNNLNKKGCCTSC